MNYAFGNAAKYFTLALLAGVVETQQPLMMNPQVLNTVKLSIASKYADSLFTQRKPCSSLIII